jgi:hypothetical protein
MADLRVAQAAERRVNRDERSQRRPDCDRFVVVSQLELTPQRLTLQSAGVDAGYQEITKPATGEVSLDIPLHGKPDEPRSASDKSVLM